MIKINGVAIATPKIYEATVSDLDGESNRNAAGQLIRDRIAVKRKLNLEWGPLSQSEIAPILNAVSGVFFYGYFSRSTIRNYNQNYVRRR